MTGMPNRLPKGKHPILSAHQIDEGEVVHFQLNGRRVSGFEGDTLLSALLGAGIDCAGMHRGWPIALDENLHLTVREKKAPDVLFPLARTPVMEGGEFETVGARVSGGIFGWRRPEGQFAQRSLGIDFDKTGSIPNAYWEMEPRQEAGANFVVVGGGVAGMEAALRASESGKSVVLFEQRAYLGGLAPLFGHALGEEAPDHMISRLQRRLKKASNVRVFLRARVLSITSAGARVHVVDGDDINPGSRVVEIQCRHVIMATGIVDRLPMFRGNRLPGVRGLAASYHLASAYGVWPAGSTVILTASNAGYGFALMGDGCGRKIEKIFDRRLAPQSRFIEFAKASGIKSERGTEPHGVVPDNKSSALVLTPGLAWDEHTPSGTALSAKSILSMGGWQPQLQLWQMVGGELNISADGQFRAVGTVSGMELAGSVAGFQSAQAVLQSAAAAVDKALGRPVGKIAEHLIDPDFETPDTSFPAAELDDPRGKPASYFSWTPNISAGFGPRKLFGTGHHQSEKLHGIILPHRAMSLDDLATIRMKNMLSKPDLNAIARERVIDPLRYSKALSLQLEQAVIGRQIPGYLTGRFDAKEQPITLRTLQGQIEAGYLLFANSDATDPRLAVGAVLKNATDGQIEALLSSKAAEAGNRFWALGPSGHIPVEKLETVLS